MKMTRIMTTKSSIKIKSQSPIRKNQNDYVTPCMYKNGVGINDSILVQDSIMNECSPRNNTSSNTSNNNLQVDVVVPSKKTTAKTTTTCANNHTSN